MAVVVAPIVEVVDCSLGRQYYQYSRLPATAHRNDEANCIGTVCALLMLPGHIALR